MWPSLIGLAGVTLGILGTLVTTRMTNRSNERVADGERTQKRNDGVRELTAEAYVAALDATQWLSVMHVEDSVDPRFAETYVPRTSAAVENLRQARRAIAKASALGGSAELSELTAATAAALSVLDDAWHSGQQYRSKLTDGSGSSSLKSFYARSFNREMQRLQQSRKQLIGFDGNDQPRDELDEGLVRPGSLLHRLREATRAP